MAFITTEIQQIESTGRLRVEKKWKNRYFVAKHPPDVDNIFIKVFKNERESRKENKCRQTIVLRTFYGSESGFVLDKETNTLAILCESLVLIMAFESLDVLRDWELWMRRAYRFGAQFQMRIVSVPPESELSRLEDPHVRLHLHDGSFCVAACCPPRVVGAWKIAHLRRFGPLHNRFVFEAGTRAGRGLSGLFSFLCTQNEHMHMMFQLAARNQLHDHLANKRSIQFAQTVLRRTDTMPTTRDSNDGSRSRLPTADSSLLRQVQLTPKSNGSHSLVSDSILTLSAPTASCADRRPLLASASSSCGEGSGVNVVLDTVDPETYTNEVFDEEDMANNDSAKSPQPFIFPNHVAPNTPNPISKAQKICKCGGSVQQPQRTPSFAAVLPTFGVIACPVHPGHGGPVWIPSPVSSPTKSANSQSSTITPSTSRESRGGNELRMRLPKEPATLPRAQGTSTVDGTCRVCSDHRNYVNQSFIDSLQQYYNFDAVFYPAAIAVPFQYVQMAPQSAPPVISGGRPEQTPHDAGYIPWDPDSRSSGQRSPPPPDPTSRSTVARPLTVRTDLDPVRPSTPSPPHLSAMATAMVPPFLPFTLPRRRTTVSSCASSGESPTRRALSTCLPLDPRLILPDEKGCARTWSLGGTVGRRRSRSVFARSSPLPDAVIESASLRRGGLLRDSSRRARRLLAVFKKMKKDASATTDTPGQTAEQVATTATVAATLAALDLDDPIFASGASARGQPAASTSRSTTPFLFPVRDLSTIVDLSSESGHALSRPSSHAKIGDVTSSPPKAVAPPAPSLSKSLRKSSSGLDPLVFRGLVKLAPVSDTTRPPVSRLMARRLSERSQQRLHDTLTSSVSGSYSVYDGEGSPRKELTSPRLTNPADPPSTQPMSDNGGDTIAAAMQRMQKMRLLSDRQATFRLGGVFGDDISATSSPKLPHPHQSESTVFRFPPSSSNPAIAPESTVNYCDLSVSIKSAPVPPSPRTSVPTIDLTKTNYARIDALSTIAAKEASDQRKLDRRMQSSSTQTLSRKSSFFSKRFLPAKRQRSFLRRRTSITSLTDL